MFDNKNPLLYPLSVIYGWVTAFRNYLYDKGILRSEAFKVPVICVGNITMGGTGKTPHTEYLAELLSTDFKVAVLSRGYKRKSKDFTIVVASSSADESGDEPLQIARKFPGMLVAVESDRVKGIKKILELQPETDVIILDDGFQHRSLTPGFSILLCDYSRPLYADSLLPYGSLREPSNNIRRADIILITKTPEDISADQKILVTKRIEKLPQQSLYFTSLTYGKPAPVFNGLLKEPGPDMDSYSNRAAVLVTGIANPGPLRKHLEKKFSEIIHLPFPDHHNFTAGDFKKIKNAWNELKTPARYLVTTEKDTMRLKCANDLDDEIKSAFYYIPVGIVFQNNDKEKFDKTIVDYVRGNKQDNRISE